MAVTRKSFELCSAIVWRTHILKISIYYIYRYIYVLVLHRFGFYIAFVFVVAVVVDVVVMLNTAAYLNSKNNRQQAM